jgi:hypothetical protein
LDEIGTEAKMDETEGHKWQCVLRYTDFMFDRSRKNQKVRVPEYTFSLLPLSLVHFGSCTNLVQFRFSSFNKMFARTAGAYTFLPFLPRPMSWVSALKATRFTACSFVWKMEESIIDFVRPKFCWPTDRSQSPKVTLSDQFLLRTVGRS